ncbi:MAG: hypothetical protein HFI68_08485 [Lachnospiraceae bacterium]|nr:hypothetical protein [Lachnospiraceae bacterium]
MTLTNEDLLAISQLLDTKLKPLEDRTKNIEILLENDILPRLQNSEACYTSTYRRYVNGSTQIEAMQADIDIMKKVISEHSKKLQKIS